MKIYLVRHGESEGNLKRFVAGQKYDVALTKEGHSEALLVGNRLKNLNIKAIYSSDLLRAKQTATAIANHHNTEVITDKRIREYNAGIFTDRNFEGFSEYKDLMAKKLGISRDNVDIPEGESRNDFCKRIESFYNEIKSKEAGDVIVVAHGGTNKVTFGVMKLISKEEMFNQKQDNTCVNEIEWDGEKWVCHRINCIDHLE